MHQLTRLRHLLIVLLRRMRAAWSGLVSAESRQADRALATGIFLRAFYDAQSGVASSTPQESMRHYLTRGAQDGLLPHPLIDAALAHDPERSAALVEAMTSRGSVPSHLFSTTVDWSAYASAWPDADRHRGGVLGSYSAGRREPSENVTIQLRNGEPLEWAPITERIAKQRRIMPKVLAAGLFDRAYYEAQVGQTFLSQRAALWHYLSAGEAEGFAANPLFEPEWYEQQRSTKGVYLLNDFINSNLAITSTHPHFDPTSYLEAVPAAGEHPGGPLGHFLAHATDTSPTWPTRDLAARPWGELRASLETVARTYAAQVALTRWGAPRPWSSGADAPATDAGGSADRLPTVSVVVDGGRYGRQARAALASILDGDYPAIEVVAIVRENDSPIDDLDPRVTVVTTASASRAERINLGVRHSTGELVHLWHSRDVPRPGFYRRSVAGLRSAGTEFVYSAAAPNGSHEGLAYGEPFDRAGLTWGNHLAVTRTAIVTRRLFDLVGGHDESLPAYSDWDFALRAGARSEPVFLSQIGVDLPGSKPRPDAPTHDHVVRAREICDWDADPVRDHDRFSILVPVYEDWDMTIQAVGAALATTDRAEVEIVLLDNGSRRSVGSLIEAVHGHETTVVSVRVPKNTNFATGSNLAFLHSTGERVVFMNNDTLPTPGWSTPLLAELDDPTVRAAQPLLLFADRTVQAAGTVFHRGALPWHFLQGHPLEDVVAANQTRFSAITAATMACRATEVRQLRGFDPVYANGMEDVDLCLRLTEELGGDFAVALDSVVVHAESQSVGRFDSVGRNREVFLERWSRRMPDSDLERYRAAGLSAFHYRGARPHPRTGVRGGSVVVAREPRIVETGPARGLPSLRWALKTAAETGSTGDLWGDTFFAEDLARALRTLGQEVVIDRRDSHVREGSDHLDDVTLALRGLTRIRPQAGTTSILWIISHPEAVSVAELADGHDLVYAASVPWSADATQRSGREVRPLLQATDPARFHPAPALPSMASHALFVGRTRNIFRPIVRDAIDAGADLTIYGDGWAAFIDETYVRADHLSNSDLPDAYRSARIVLNDHWTDMAELGFLSNRLFDAAACGALVVTDEVDGLGETFGDLVRAYAGVGDLKDLLAADRAPWLADDERHAQALAVAEHHSFDARARTLLADVLDQRGIAHGLRD